MEFLFYLKTGFSFASWLTTNGVTRTEPLPSTVTAKLMSDTGIAAYLHEPPCDQTGTSYSGAVGGIKNGKILKIVFNFKMLVFLCVFPI